MTRVAGERGDLDTVDQLAEMVRRFYADAAQDALLGPLFNEVAKTDWAEHLPRVTAFWSRALFGIHGYTGNPMRHHARVHALSSFEASHFERWLELFHAVIDEGWAGPFCERAKVIARRVAGVHGEYLTGQRVEFTGAGPTPPSLLRVEPAPRPPSSGSDARPA